MRRLDEMDIRRVDLVGKPANKRAFLLVKQEDPSDVDPADAVPAAPEEAPAVVPEETPAVVPEVPAAVPEVAPEEAPAAPKEETPAAAPEETPAVVEEETPEPVEKEEVSMGKVVGLLVDIKALLSERLAPLQKEAPPAPAPKPDEDEIKDEDEVPEALAKALELLSNPDRLTATIEKAVSAQAQK